MPAGMAQNVSKQEGLNKNEETERLRECKICMDEKINTVCVPCGHQCLCVGCSKKIQGQCPICKQAVEQVIKTFET